MNHHRDNSCAKTLKQLADGDLTAVDGGHASGSALNSQVLGSNVIVFTTGDAPQEFVLGFATASDLLTKNRDDAKVIRPKFTFTLDNGTISVLDPIDDLTFTHEAFFAKGTDGKLRRAWVFRWLQAAERFYADTGGTVLSAQHEAQLKGKQRADAVDGESPAAAAKQSTKRKKKKTTKASW